MTVMADRPQLARSTVEVKDADVDGLRRAPLAGATVRGKVRLAGNVGEADASLLFVYLRRAEGEDDVSEGAAFPDDGTVASPGTGRVNADSSFELKNVPPGLYQVEVSGDSQGMSDCFVESVVAGTNDVATSGHNVAGGTISVGVTLSCGAGVVEGMVADDRNEPIANAVVVAVPEAKYRKRRSHDEKVATDQHGHFTMRGLRPGEYTLFARETLEGDDYFDPEYLKKYPGRETAIRLDKGGRQNTSLKLIPAPADPPQASSLHPMPASEGESASGRMKALRRSCGNIRTGALAERRSHFVPGSRPLGSEGDWSLHPPALSRQNFPRSLPRQCV